VAGDGERRELPSFRPGPVLRPWTRRIKRPPLRDRRSRPQFMTLPCPWDQTPAEGRAVAATRHRNPKSPATCLLASTGKRARGAPFGNSDSLCREEGGSPLPVVGYAARFPVPYGDTVGGDATQMIMDRDREPSRVTGFLDDALAGRRRLVLYAGEAGIDGTRSLDHGLRLPSAGTFRWLGLEGLVRGSSRPYGQ